MKIRKITAKNFKSFESIEVNNLLDMNFIFGFNNSGKSNLLRLIQTIFSSKLDISEVRAETTSKISTQKVGFWQGIIEKPGHIFKFGAKDPISFQVTVDVLSESIAPDAVESLTTGGFITSGQTSISVVIEGTISAQGIDAMQKLTKVTIGTTEAYNESNPQWKNGVESLLNYMTDSILFLDYDRYFKSEEEKKEIGELTPAQFKNWLFNLSLAGNRKEEFDRILSSSKKFKVSSSDNGFANNEKSNPFNKEFSFKFRREGDNIDLYFLNEFNEIPLSSFGTGVQQLIYIIFKIFESQPKVLLLEELELNLSPKYQDIFIKFLDKLIRTDKIVNQAFITTHSALHCYRSQDRSLSAKMDANGNTTFAHLTLSKDEHDKLQEALKILKTSVYGLTEQD